jgi:DNA-binding NarL/FixJ family response regulator
MDKITVLLVDDHKMVTNAFASMLNDDGRFNVIGEAASIDEAISIVTIKRPGIVLMEIRMDPEFILMKSIGKISPGSKMIGLTVYAIAGSAKKFMRAGGMGYVTKNSTTEELKTAIVEVYEGRKFVCKEIKDSLSRQALEDGNDYVNTITQKELEVISYIKQGFSSKEIGELMYLSTKTVEVHRYNILKKLKLRNVAELVNYINMQGL